MSDMMEPSHKQIYELLPPHLMDLLVKLYRELTFVYRQNEVNDKYMSNNEKPLYTLIYMPYRTLHEISRLDSEIDRNHVVVIYCLSGPETKAKFLHHDLIHADLMKQLYNEIDIVELKNRLLVIFTRIYDCVHAALEYVIPEPPKMRVGGDWYW